MPDYFSMENYYANVTPPTKRQEQLAKELESIKREAHEHNNSKASEKSITGPLKRFCPLDENLLVKSKKTQKMEGLDIEIPVYKCPLCHTKFSGIGTELYSSNHKLKAIVFEHNGTL